MKIRRIISKERLEEMIKYEDCDPDYNCSLNEEVLPSEIISMARELRAWRKADRFSNNQNHCGGYNAGCDGDLVGMPHEKGCPARKLDMELRPHLYMPAPPEVSNEGQCD